MKYKFDIDEDIITLSYKDKTFNFKRNVKLISEMQKLVLEARKKMIMDFSKEGQSINSLVKETKKDGKTYYDNSNKVELEKVYQEQVTLEYFNNKCIEIFNMDLVNLMNDIGLETEEEGNKFSNDFMNYLSGNIPR